MKILSLFDGMACGALAMQAAGIEIEKYVAYEVDKYAIQTAQHNFPFIEECGDVFNADFTEYAGFDYLIGGSPCTYWSIAQTKNRETVASGMGWELFSQYVRALHEAKPRFFLYENNKSMSAAIRASITETFGFEPILINSALVSAQNRQRLYWCGIRQADGTYRKADIQQPADRGILLKDILETNGKCAILTTCQGGHREPKVFEKIADPVCVAQRGRYDESGKVYQHYEAQPTGKTNNLTTVSKDNLIAEPICVNSKSGRAGVEGLQPSLQDRVYDTSGKMPAVTSSFNPKIAEPVKLGEIGKGGQGNRVYSIDGKAVTQTAQSGGMGSNMGVYAEPVKNHIAEYSCGSQVFNINPSGKGMNGCVMHCEGKSRTITINKGEGPKIIEPLRVNEAAKAGYPEIKYCNDKNIAHICRPFGSKAKVITENEKAPTLMAAMGTGGGNGVYYAENMKVREITNAPIYEVKDGYITVKGNKYPIKLVDGFYIIRKLTVRECMRLQTVPEWYEWPVSKSQAYKMLGNGWTVEVIAHLLRGLK